MDSKIGLWSQRDNKARGPLFVWMAEVELIPATMVYPDGEISRLDPKNDRDRTDGGFTITSRSRMLGVTSDDT